MQRTDVERLFQMACAAFPRGGVAVFDGGSPLMSREFAECSPPPPRAEMRKEASVFSQEGRLYYRIQLPLPPSFRFFLYLRAEDYSSAAVPVRMLDALAAEARRGGDDGADETSAHRAGENQLLNSLLYVLFRKKIDAKYEGYVHMAGLAALMALMLVVTLSDVGKLFGH